MDNQGTKVCNTIICFIKSVFSVAKALENKTKIHGLPSAAKHDAYMTLVEELLLLLKNH